MRCQHFTRVFDKSKSKMYLGHPLPTTSVDVFVPRMGLFRPLSLLAPIERLWEGRGKGGR